MRITNDSISNSIKKSDTIQINDDIKLSGRIQIQIEYGENLKPSNNTGSSNPYVIIKVPEGTDIPTTADNVNSVLNGKDCELARTRVVYESLNPTWAESFRSIIPPIEQIYIEIYSKNKITADQLIGTSSVNLQKGYSLRNQLSDHHTHDVFIEMSPQGRILTRFTLEGDKEDVEFWFTKTKERLGRTKDDFARALTVKVVFLTFR